MPGGRKVPDRRMEIEPWALSVMLVVRTLFNFSSLTCYENDCFVFYLKEMTQYLCIAFTML